MNFQELPQPQKRESKAENAREIFNHCFEIEHIEDGQRIPVGGSGFKSAEHTKFAIADLSRFHDLYNSVTKGADSLDGEKIRSWLEVAEIKMDSETFAKLYAFTRIFAKNYPQNPDYEPRRLALYEVDEVLVSDVLSEQVQECAEVAAVAQGYLQQEGISSSYLSGEVLWSEDAEFPMPHSFIIIRENGKTFIYDPTNPIHTQDGILPSIYEPNVDLDTELRKKKKVFIRSTNVMTHEDSFFGVGDHASLSPERHIVG
jgi:hypothetical protein